MRRFRRSELPRDTIELARFLVGKVLVRETDGGRTSGRIVETEAYLVGDAAAHSFRGLTARNKSLFLERGHAYVYFIYGCWFALNVSAEVAGTGAGVLLRALEPLEGIETMRERRGGAKLIDLARGPGRLATAMAVDRSLDGTDLCAKGALWLAAGAGKPAAIGESVRIGITREVDRMLRFFELESPYVSGPKRLRR
jgi:DNA-3-methyladenine glycosylase